MSAYKSQARAQLRRNGFAQIIFSDKMTLEPWQYRYTPNGERFKKYLLKNFPNSSLVELEAKNSPSTGNNIKTYIWNIPHAAFKKHKFYPKTRART